MKDRIKECVNSIEDVALLIEEYKMLEKKNEITDYQQGFLDGYTHMKLILNLVNIIEEKTNEI